MSRPETPLLLVLAGPAGSGKSTLCDRLIKAGLGFSRVVTATTRSPRPGEQQGVHYHFLTAAEFDAEIERGAFIEWAWVHGDRRYGTLASSILEPLARGEHLVANLDVQGVASLRKAARQHPLIQASLTTVFILVDRAEMERRIRARGADDEAEIARRMQTAVSEQREADRFEHLIHSGTRDEDFAALATIITKRRSP